MKRHRMIAFSYYEGGEWIAFDAQIDDLTLTAFKLAAFAVARAPWNGSFVTLMPFHIAGTTTQNMGYFTVYALKDIDDNIWDCKNGWRTEVKS